MSEWLKKRAESVAELIREVTVYRLGGYDGCPCTSFEVQSVHVEVACHKSGDHGLRVYSNNCDWADEKGQLDEAACKPIVDEVLRQIDQYYDADGEYAATFEVSYQSWESERKRA